MNWMFSDDLQAYRLPVSFQGINKARLKPQHNQGSELENCSNSSHSAGETYSEDGDCPICNEAECPCHLRTYTMILFTTSVFDVILQIAHNHGVMDIVWSKERRQS